MPVQEARDAAEAGYRAYDAFDHAVGDVMGVLNAAGAKMIELTRQCMDEEHWKYAGCRSVEHWLTSRCGMSTGRAKRTIAVAERLHEFPMVEAKARSGLVTEDLLAVVAAEADATHDRQLSECIESMMTSRLHRFIRSLPPPPPSSEVGPEPGPEPDPPKRKPTREAPREELRFGWDADGRFTGSFNLNAAAGALLEQAFRAARAKLFNQRTGRDPDDEDAPLDTITWADALEHLAGAALDQFDPATMAGREASTRYQAWMHVDGDNLERARVHLGPLLSPEVRREILCDCDIRVVLYWKGRPIDLGRRQRVTDPELRAVIELRDGGCRVCGAKGHLHIHHLVHWEHGGPTDSDNLVALCTACHRDVHAGRIRLSGDPNRDDFLVLLGDGRPLPTPAATPVRALPPSDVSYRGPDRSGRWNFGRPPAYRDTDDSIVYF